MRTKNFKLLQALYEFGRPQYEIAKMAGFSSEARLSRIVGLRVVPTATEIDCLTKTLGKSPQELGFDMVIPYS